MTFYLAINASEKSTQLQVESIFCDRNLPALSVNSIFREI